MVHSCISCSWLFKLSRQAKVLTGTAISTFSLNSDFIFTSPTLYIAYDSITAQDRCRGGYVGKTYAPSIIPITGQISSLAVQYLVNGTTMNREEAASAIAYQAQQDGLSDPFWHQQPLGMNWTSIVGARVPPSGAIQRANRTRASLLKMAGRYITKALELSDLESPIPAGAYFEAMLEGQCYGLRWCSAEGLCNHCRRFVCAQA
jgi:hypothetical protein